MSFDSDFKAHLQGGIASLVNDRIHPIVRHAGSALPAVSYQIITEQPQNSIDGFTSGITKYRLQVDCWATTYDGMTALKVAVQNRMNTATAAFTSVLEFGQDVYDDETKLFRSILDFSCGVTE